MNYYNENDPGAAQWLCNLIDQKLIPAGKVDQRSIEDVSGHDLDGFTQCHFFAGIGGWPLALQLAGWPVDRPVWTGSCPCQPFSCAGKRQGEKDKRHLWPHFLRLIAERKPAIVFGEQVASKDGRAWLAGVRDDLEALGNVVGAADLCAAGVGAPHIRQRLYWMAYAASFRRDGLPAITGSDGACDGRSEISQRWTAVESSGSGIDHTALAAALGTEVIQPGHPRYEYFRNRNGQHLGMVYASGPRPQGHAGDGDDRGGQSHETRSTAPAGAWGDFYIVHCRDGKSRRVGRGVAPLAHGLPKAVDESFAAQLGMGAMEIRDVRASLKLAKRNRIVQLRGYGNAIVPQVAAEFIAAAMQLTDH